MIFPFVAVVLFSLVGHAQDGSYILADKEIFVPKLESTQALTSHPRFTGFIQQMFNRPGDFHGPNCYNTALIASGYFSVKNKRYVSPEEFEGILKADFNQVSAPEYKDLIVFDAKSSRGHAAFYLGDNLIFHKKSFGTQYHYRIVEVDNAGVVEENEWVPGIMEDSTAQMNWPELGNLPKNYFRRNSGSVQLDHRLAPLIKKMEEAMLVDLKTWAIGRKWGMTGEYFLEDLMKYAKTLKTDKYTEGVLISLKDQIYIMLEEVYFKNARSAEKVLEEICIPEQKEALFGFIKEFGKLLSTDAHKIESVLKALDEQDKSRCRLHPIDLLLK
jgi:hypothetical protein